MGDFEAAKSDLNIYLNIYPAHYSSLLLRGLAAHYLGDHAEAIEYLTRAIEAEPNNGSTYCRRATAFRALGKTSEATADLTRCRKLLVV
jgi:Tfp pilus assembly protein PilF